MISTLSPLRFICVLIAFALGSTAAVVQAQSPGGAGSSLTPEQKLELALRKIDAEEFREAERLIGEVTVEKPSLTRLLLVRGLYFNAVQRYTEAVADLEKFNSLKEARGEWRGLATLGDIYLRSRMWRSAVMPLEQAKEFAPVKENGKPVRADILLNLASAQLGLENFKTAVATAKSAQEVSPEVGDVHLRLAEIARSSNDFETAVAAVDKAVFLFKNDIRDDAFNRTAHEKLRRCYDILSNLYQYQLRSDPENAEYYAKYSQMLLQSAEVDRRRTLLDALQLARQAIERAPKRIDFKLALVRLEFELGGIKDAKDALDDILQQDPKNSEAIELKQKLESSPPRPSLS